MNGFTRFFDPFRELMRMPFFYVRLFSLAAVLACDNLIRVYVLSPARIPLIVIASVAGAVFAFFEILTLLRLKPRLYFSPVPMLLWLVFGVFCVISELVNHCFGYSLLLLIAMPVVVYCAHEEHFFHFILTAFAVSAVADVAVGVIFCPLTNNSYSVSLAALVPVILSVMAWVLLNREKNDHKWFILLGILLSLTILLSVLSGGRTGFFAILATLLCFVIAVIIKFVSAATRHTFRYSRLMFWIVIIVSVLVLVTVLGALILDSHPLNGEYVEHLDGMSIWEKTWQSMINGNPFSNRGMIWKYTFSNVSLFGHNSSFYADASCLTPDQYSAHNSFLGVLGIYGLLAFAAFMLFCLYMLVVSVRYALSSRQLYLFPFLSLIDFFVASITEDLVVSWGPRKLTVLFFCACALLIRREGLLQYRTPEFKAER